MSYAILRNFVVSKDLTSLNLRNKPRGRHCVEFTLFCFEKDHEQFSTLLPLLTPWSWTLFKNGAIGDNPFFVGDLFSLFIDLKLDLALPGGHFSWLKLQGTKLLTGDGQKVLFCNYFFELWSVQIHISCISITSVTFYLGPRSCIIPILVLPTNCSQFRAWGPGLISGVTLQQTIVA